MSGSFQAVRLSGRTIVDTVEYLVQAYRRTVETGGDRAQALHEAKLKLEGLLLLLCDTLFAVLIEKAREELDLIDERTAQGQLVTAPLSASVN